jgi:3-phenylpropionate/trans-cinnamate dioxygenase ferredoxin reductase subunit
MSSDSRTFVIAGAGQAGGEIAAELRKQGFGGRVVLVGEEPHIPYKRPPLSKAYFAGSAKLESLYVLPQTSLDKIRVEFMGNTRVERIDRAAKTVALSNGTTLAYDKLALALGGRARPLNLPGANRPNVHLLRTIADVDAIRARVAPGKRMVVIGGGFIGLETAAVAVKLGLKVTVLEGLPRVLARVTVPEISAFFERIHREAGVDLRTGVQVTALEGEPEVTHVVLDGGERVSADFVVVGIGLIPNVELAQAAGLAVDNGIVVDEHTRSSDPDIVAAGDCTNHPTHSSAAASAWSRCRTRWSRAAPQRRRCWAGTRPTAPCPGSGRTSTTSSCRWRGSPPATTSWCCAATRRRSAPSPPSTCARGT